MVWAALERVAAEKCREREIDATLAAESVESTQLGEENVPAGTFGDHGLDDTLDVPVGTSGNHQFDDTLDVPAGTSGDRELDQALDVPAGTSGDHRLDVPAGTSGDQGRDLPARTTRDQGGRKTPAFDRASALVAMAQAVIRGEHPDRSPYQLMISVAASTLQRDADPDPASVACCGDGTCISADAVRRLACDASVVTFLEDANGTAISVGRKTRTIPGAMKRALFRRDQTCRFPGCRTRVFLEGHHMRHWANGGETKLSNLIVCCDHHRFVHEYGYQIELTPEGDVVVFDQAGRPMSEVPEPMSVPGSWPGDDHAPHRRPRDRSRHPRDLERLIIERVPQLRLDDGHLSIRHVEFSQSGHLHHSTTIRTRAPSGKRRHWFETSSGTQVVSGIHRSNARSRDLDPHQVLPGTFA